MVTQFPRKSRGKARFAAFARSLAEILARCLAVPGQTPRWTIIANPQAGGFTIGGRWRWHEAALNAARERARRNPLRDGASPSRYALSLGVSPEDPVNQGLILTAGPGNAAEITSALIGECSQTLTEKAPPGGKPFYLIITAGGDGTSLEVLQTLYAAPEEVRSRFAVLRLPLGTGNDGADSPGLAGALDLLVLPSRLEKTRGIILKTASGKTRPGGGPFLAFNVLSLGLDAFVTHMTNKMKDRLPGDSYKLWVDIAALLYDRVYTVGPMGVLAYDENGKEVARLQEKILLCAMGISGRRTYGSQKKILPDDRNVCVVRQMSLFRKLAIKGLFTTGGHVRRPESVLTTAVKLRLSPENPILAQMDGETTLLTREDFPLTLELTSPVIQKLVPAGP
ncbi:MAG: diacylglycerol kinase [Treponema sp.]|jgi:diacylglycerol kinase family enzyme|nr:diacylglycerol kinase [Treponema sp.]